MQVSTTLRTRFFHRLRISGIILVFLSGGAFLVLALKWPFTHKGTIQSLERVSASEVRIANFRKIFFPHPGYIAENVTFSRNDTTGPRQIATIGKLTCRATWFTLLTFTHRINRMELEGFRVYIPAHVPPAIRKHGEAEIKTTVTELVADGTVLEFAARRPGGHTIIFEFPKLAAGNLARNKAITFRAELRNPNPPGDLRISGAVGPLIPATIAQTPISGLFRLMHADLGSYKVIAGDLSADGRFNGSLGQAEVVGNAHISNFEVTSSRHSLGVTLEYHALVDGTNGDVAVESAQAHFLGTTLLARGRINGKQGKTVSLDFDGPQARIEDLLRLFVKADRPPLEGPLALRAHVILPPTHSPFIQRVQLDGDFTIHGGEFTNSTTQEKIDELSARARGDKAQIKAKSGPERVTEDLKGVVRLRNATATLSTALLVVPGAVAGGSGTYEVTSQAIDLRGHLAMHASLSQAASGIKSVVLTPLDPLFKKNGAGAVLPVRISGTYSHPVFKVSLK